METPAVSNTVWSPYDPPVTHRCDRFESDSKKEYCDDPLNSSSWPCHQASCDICLDLDRNFHSRVTGNGSVINITNFLGITASASHGCQNCILLFKGIESLSRSMIEQDPAYWEEIKQSNHLEIEMRVSTYILVSVCGRSPAVIPRILEAEFHIHPEDTLVEKNNISDLPLMSSSYPTYYGFKYVPLKLDIDVLIAFAKEQLNHCVRNHQHCSSIELKARPTRLLDIRAEGTRGDVVLTTLKDKTTQYLALSHCWGKNSAIITTTRRTLAQRMLSIPFSDLTKTFQDAVLVTRALGFRYLWIDSLCIIQDDRQDWELESTKMAGIYMGSALTIAATATTDSNGGFFINRRSLQADGRKMMYLETFQFRQTLSGQNVVVHVRPLLSTGHSEFFANSTYRQHFGISPLLSRAWVYQERLLAPRMLHVHMTEVFFECRTSTACECGNPWTMIGKHWSKEMQHSRTSKSRLSHAIKSATSVEDVQILWRQIVLEYSKLALTKESDRLPALSALANFLSQKFQTPYLAGLWENNLLKELLWYRCSGDETFCYRSDRSKMPSWSWASLVRKDGDADDTHSFSRGNRHLENFAIFGLSEDYRIKILQASCEVAGLNPFGEVSGGTVSIEGAVIIAKLGLHPIQRGEPPSLPGLSNLAARLSKIVFQEESCIVYLDLYSDESDDVSDGEMVSCILFGFIGGGMGQVLVLKAVESWPDTYRRIGLLGYYDRSKLKWFDGVAPSTVHII